MLISGISGFINMVIPAVIFLFINDKIFLSKKFDYSTKQGKKMRNKKLVRLIFVSPIGFFLALFIVLISMEMIISSFLFATGIIEFTSESTFSPKLSISHGLSLVAGGYSTSNDGLLATLAAAVIIAIPVLFFVIKRYCKIIGCSTGLGIFVYMAVLYMYLTSTLITMPISDINPTAESLIATGSFIVMLLIFYQSAAEKIEFMRENEDSELLHQINTLPVINFILQVILLGLEVMIQINGYMDLAYYIIILAFALILYISAQLAYNILFRHIEERSEIEALTKESLASQEQVTLAFAEITEAKSGQTGQHIKRVSEYSRVLAQGLGYSTHDVETIRIASMMHDVGKLLIAPEILEKRGRLTDEEFEIMKTHVIIGENLLHNAPGEIMNVARVIAQQHHEKWNGTGYLGMKGEEIDRSARITAVADVYDALTSNRSYKKAWYSEQAFDMIKNERGEHFDPEVVDVFIEHFDEIKAIQEQYADNKK